MYRLQQLNFEKGQTILKPEYYNHKCMKKINLMAFQKIFFSLNEFQNYFLKNEKINKIGLKYHRYMIQRLVLRILRCSF